MLDMRAPTALLLAALACVPLSAAADRTLGAGVTLTEPTRLEDVIATPASFEGKTIRVDGVVTAVCEHQGCWMTLAPPTSNPDAPKTLRLKVEDGVIVFPVSAKGRAASAQGTIEKTGGDDHHGNAGTYQLRATGAVLR